MKVIICDKCGRQTSLLSMCASINFPEESDELQLCPTCSMEVRRWVKGEPEEESHDYSSGVSF